MGAHRNRSRCPIAFCLDVVGDRWTLLILRDLAFFRRRSFGDFLASAEGISSNILAERLRRLERSGLVVRVPDPQDRRRARFFLTEDGLDLLPVLVEMTIWGGRRHPNSSVPRAQLERWSDHREELIARQRGEHAAEREQALADLSVA